MNSIAITQVNDLDIIVEEIVEFDNTKKQEYFKLFVQNIKNGIIKEGTNFNDKRWIIVIGGEEHSIIFPNDIELKILSEFFERNVSEFELAYRSFLLLNFNNANSILNFNKNIKRITKDCENIKFDRDIIGKIKSFINYIKISDKTLSLFENIFDNIDDQEYSSRILPEFEDIFKMSDIINDIVENKNLLDYIDYLLVIMWWKICSILPLRPSEFLRTKFNCIYEKEGEFYSKVRRTRAKIGDRIRNISKVDEYYYEDTVNIDESLFNLIIEYQGILRDKFNYTENLELFPYEIIRNVGQRKYAHAADRREKNKNMIICNDLRGILNKFYKFIVESEYGFKTIPKYIKKEKDIEYIEKTLPYDLRHIAIINLVLMGSDVLEVMHLAGHKEINTAYSYYSHVKEFSRGYALGYAKAIKSREKLKGKIKDVNDTQEIIDQNNRKEEANYIFNIINGKKVEPKRVDGVYCHYSSIDMDKSFCFLYERNHSLCQYFVTDNKKVLESEIKKVEAELDTDIKVLKDLINDMNGIFKFNELYQTTSYRISKRIQELAVLNRKLLMEEK